jgi:electron transfer flavoprotein alpha subunit
VPVLDGRILYTFSCPEARPQIATLVPGAFPAAVEEAYRSGTVEQVSVSPGSARGKIQWLDMDARVDKAPIPLSGAKIIVGAGRGLRDQAGLALARQLADLLDGQMAGSRGALDEGWIDNRQLIGMSGQTVRPKLYIACGVSGAIQHNMGLQETGFLVAINQDDQAPMMQVANVGAVGDTQQIISALIRELADLSHS